ncbi:hypothetical protein MPL1032_100137 [Mesorhizobium plurifarium]|uniref:Uncharacterized protein n=1 Tax=Mesorhizobium plurifarium TaxID=69974 RepID=A0A0K2VNC9_MESPL|nr:hypothetical protein MPL1032_100137 [Mesorhizobium plurifarium]
MTVLIADAPKRVAIFQVRSMRFGFFDLAHVFIPKPVPTFGRHALSGGRHERRHRTQVSGT